ncbi:glycosyltransferase family 2 protein [Polynucleobacter sp. JS-Polo-80-F4]|uniref:glycosyltransferase family 2 protein n=1 Tax=Polynucleobacter sp. JS-Polo-80-F4 TaxID=2576918 RepID=UPI001C0E0F1F|nr:glycosyltransferase family 2 protein [Polynucleobacter sp. JS-Polo-80-F4]MBU3615844.1 glycosyltransferase family 2 protein [Polynucleobacter sp. JS-Polo-80-F4]
MLSIIIPTYNEPTLLYRAISSVLKQSSGNWELIVCPDDGKDYSYVTEIDKRITLATSDQKKTGPGPSRNRGIEYVKGSAIAYLDDDDQITERYVELALEGLKNEPAMIFSTSYINGDDSIIRTIGSKSGEMTIDGFAYELGSLHTVCRKEIFTKWRNCFAEDVVHTCEILDKIGGAVKVSTDAQYLATVRSGSLCTSSDDINASYQKIIASKLESMSTTGQVKMSNLFTFRKLINSLYISSNNGQGYHDFVKSIDETLKQKIFKEAFA